MKKDMLLWLVYNDNQILMFKWSLLFHTTENIFPLFSVDTNKAGGSVHMQFRNEKHFNHTEQCNILVFVSKNFDEIVW